MRKGQKWSEKQKDKLRGEANCMFGKKQSKESRKEQARKMIGKFSGEKNLDLENIGRRNGSLICRED